jgi:hypothetical protein
MDSKNNKHALKGGIEFTRCLQEGVILETFAILATPRIAITFVDYKEYFDQWCSQGTCIIYIVEHY